jgi:putative membrane protein
MQHSRRTALIALAAAGSAPMLLTASRALAQANAPTDGGQYAAQTLMAGTFSLESSRIAAEKALDPLVKQFAELEFAEQTTIAQILTSTGVTPPELPAERQQMLTEMGNMETNAQFDINYVETQIAGHQELLAIQQTLSGAAELSVEVITAKLAEQAITSHIAMLQHIQTHLAGSAA